MDDENGNNNLLYTENQQQQQQEHYDMRAVKTERQRQRMYNPIIVAAMILILWPIGLYYMWKGKVYNKPVRIIISIAVGILATLKIIGLAAA